MTDEYWINYNRMNHNTFELLKPEEIEFSKNVYLKAIVCTVANTPTRHGFASLKIYIGGELIRESHVKKDETIITYVERKIKVGTKIIIDADASVDTKLMVAEDGCLNPHEKIYRGCTKLCRFYEKCFPPPDRVTSFVETL